ncbi:MAG: ABC transporter substrate-binding protein [Deltaproteobacteria bacterium]|nr:ABC transporter substrate-binding protein [Deltaproteobacteria bacterium]MBI2531989.1 ABC transporter substrate-binding protein [Deltaproteobacteria bacterium]
MAKSTRVFAVVFSLIALALQCAASATAADNRKVVRLKVGYASISGNRIPLWATKDIEFFSRNGLDAELIFIASSSQGIPALLSGEVPIYSGSFDTAAQAAAAGADLVIIGSSEPTPYKLIVKPDIKSVADLRGKKVGIDRIGGASYYATRRILAKLGLKPEDVEYMQVTGGGNQRVAAFHSGILSAVVSTVERFERAGIPYRALADAVELGIRIIGNAYVTSRSFRDQNRDTVQRFIKGLVEGTHWVKDPKNRSAVRQLISRRLRTDDPAVLDLNYRMYVEPLSPFPDTDLDDLKTNLAQLAENNARLRELNLASFVDNSFIQRLQRR